MAIVYIIDDKEYKSLWSLRRDYPNLIFSNNADDKLLAGIGITKKEIAAPQPTPEQLEAQQLAKAKQERAKAVSNITVDVDGMVFDGDEAAQSRMARTIVAAEAMGESAPTTTQWVLHDNTVAVVTKEQLQQALSEAMLAMAALWTVPYTGESNAE